MEIHFHIFSVKANGVENSSSVNIGTNLLIGFGSSTKTTMGSGQITGDQGHMPTLTNWIDDRDLVDTPSLLGAGSGPSVPPWQCAAGNERSCERSCERS